MEEIIEHIEHYVLHDPIGNVEGAITEYDTEKLQAAEDNGAVFIAVYNTGKREIVKAADISEPEPTVNGITVVQPLYVDSRLEAVCAVFDALEETLEKPSAAFQEALASLKALVCGEG